MLSLLLTKTIHTNSKETDWAEKQNLTVLLCSALTLKNWLMQRKYVSYHADNDVLVANKVEKT